MAKINLLPWRAELREQRKKEFLIICAATFLLSLVMAGMVWMFYQSKLDDQLQANQMVTTANSELDRQLESLKGLQERRDQIIERMKVIQDLQGTRPLIVRIFDEIVRTLPDGVYFRGMERTGQQITLRGTAESNNRVSSLMRRLDASEWFSEPTLKGVKANPGFGEQANDFDLTVKVSMPGVTGEDGQGEAGE